MTDLIDLGLDPLWEPAEPARPGALRPRTGKDLVADALAAAGTVDLRARQPRQAAPSAEADEVESDAVEAVEVEAVEVDEAASEPAPGAAVMTVASDQVDPGSIIDSVLQALEEERRLVHVRRIDARVAGTGSLARPLPTALLAHLPHRELWAHQARAIDLARDGQSLVVASGTASGKSLCYQLPIAEAVLDGGTALMAYPTKALAQDQLTSLTSWEVPGLTAATFDGDCTPEEKSWVREHANVLLTNPEMLHQSILANHQRWVPFLQQLRFVVIDELHNLRGVFGTHVAQILRRLRRLIRHYGGAEPTFVFTSATIGDPGVLASSLCGVDVQVVTDDASPSGHRSVALWNPAEETDGERWSTNAEAALLASRLITAGLRTLVFCGSRRATELVAADIRRAVPDELSDSVRSYCAGYLAEERREIELELFSGKLRGVVATNALELGVDIGGLDAVVLCGYPGTIASFWQQVGRSGRSQLPSLAVLVAGENQLDQWMMRHHDELFSRAPEPAVVNLDNPYVYVPHLGCASHELPLRHRDDLYWPTQLDEGIRRLVIDDRATVHSRRAEQVVVWSGRGTPAPTIGLRSASRGEIRIVDEYERMVGTVDDARALQAVHQGAVYLRQGRALKVTELDLSRRTATVEPCTGDTYTQARTTTNIRLLQVDDTRTVGASTLRVGSVEVTTQVTGYQTRSVSTHEVLARDELDLPPSQLETRAVWYTFDESVISRAHIDPADLPGALHAAEHAAIGILPLFTICDRWDVGGVSTEWLPETGDPTIVIHDAYPGGAGIAELAFGVADRHLAAALEVLGTCGCADGCPSCVQSPKCGNGNEPLDKHAARRLLASTLGLAVPTPPDPDEQVGF
ncbi:DEAD/DEAH box helicase [soil metagenome]